MARVMQFIFIFYFTLGISFGQDPENLLSQALEHEVDHLNGILYTDHLVSHEKLFRLEDLEEVSNKKICESDPSLVSTSESQGVRAHYDSSDSPASVKVK